MNLEFYCDKPHVCKIVGHSEKYLKLEVRSPITPSIMTVNILVGVRTGEAGVLAALEIMQIEASFE